MRLIFDGDYPMAFGPMTLDRDLTRPIEEVRSAAPGPGRRIADDAWRDSETLATLPEMRRGKVAGALVKVCVCIKKPGHDHGEFRSAETAYAHAMGQLAYYRILEAKGEARILANRGTSPSTCGPGRRPRTTLTYRWVWF